MKKENKTEETVVAQPEEVANRKPAISTEVADQMAIQQLEAAERAMMPTEKMLAVMARFADYCVRTRQLPQTIDTAEKAIMVFQAGRELGIAPMKSLYSFYFVNNKLTMYGSTVIERIRMWGKIEYGECNDKTATVTITRKDDGTSLSSTVTMEDLKDRGLAGKDTFKKHGRTMLLYKAVGEIVRHIVPEAVGSMAVEGDWGSNANEEKRSGATPQEGAVDVITVSDEDVEDAIKQLSDAPSKAAMQRVYASLKPAVKLDDRVQNFITGDNDS